VAAAPDPPKPRTEVFPPLRLLARVMKHEETPARSPWWLTLLRLLMATLVILALARPVLNPVADVASGEGPLALLIDNGWSTGADWDDRMAQATRLVSDAGEAGRPSPSPSPSRRPMPLWRSPTPRNPARPRRHRRRLPPSPTASPPSPACRPRWRTAGATLAWLSDGIAGANADTITAINALDLDEVLLFDGGIGVLRAIRGIDNTPTSFDVAIVAPDGLGHRRRSGFRLRL
jgi:hypothetical protein